MLSNTSPNSMPGKAYAKPSKTVIETAMAETSTDTEIYNDVTEKNISIDLSSEMVEKPFDNLSNPQGYTFFSPF